MSLSLSASHSYWELPATHGVYRRMRAKISLLVMIVCLSSTTLYAAKGKQAVETKPEHEQLIREGITLHDEGKYKEAIERYDRVLAENPDDVLAIYEKTYAQTALHEYKNCEKLAKQALEYEGVPERLRQQLFVSRGTCQDESGSWKDAVKTYQQGSKEFPESPSLYFNLGVTFLRQNQLKDARESFQQALRRDPLHASSHLMLGRTYLSSQYKIPAVLALSRFLILEPASPRSAQAAQMLLNAVQGGVSLQGKGTGKVTITLAPSSSVPKDEGDFGSLEIMLPMLVAGASMDKGKEKSHQENLQTLFAVLFGALEPKSSDKAGFAESFYAPYFKQLSEKKFPDTFVGFAIRNLEGADDKAWLAANQQNVRDFLAWSEAYAWK